MSVSLLGHFCVLPLPSVDVRLSGIFFSWDGCRDRSWKVGGLDTLLLVHKKFDGVDTMKQYGRDHSIMFLVFSSISSISSSVSSFARK